MNQPMAQTNMPKKPARQIKALLFDMDGTLRDSRVAIVPAIEHALRHHTGTVPEGQEHWRHMHSLRQVHAVYAQHINYDDFIATYDAKLKPLSELIELYDGVENVLTRRGRLPHRLFRRARKSDKTDRE
jgi:beta-phosphoglucomutase-like phosphatase (HAD superfamily)